jgi:hypothetical protein
MRQMKERTNTAAARKDMLAGLLIKHVPEDVKYL